MQGTVFEDARLDAIELFTLAQNVLLAAKQALIKAAPTDYLSVA